MAKKNNFLIYISIGTQICFIESKYVDLVEYVRFSPICSIKSISYSVELMQNFWKNDNLYDK